MFSIAAILIKKLENDSNDFIPCVLDMHLSLINIRTRATWRSSELKQNVIFLEGKEQRGPQNPFISFCNAQTTYYTISPNAINYVLL